MVKAKMPLLGLEVDERLGFNIFSHIIYAHTKVQNFFCISRHCSRSAKSVSVKPTTKQLNFY